MKDKIKVVLLLLIGLLLAFDITVAAVLAKTVYEVGSDEEVVIIDESEDAWTPAEVIEGDVPDITIDSIEVAEAPSNAVTNQALPFKIYEDDNIIAQAELPADIDIMCTPVDVDRDGVFYDIWFARNGVRIDYEALVAVEFKQLDEGEVIKLDGDDEVNVTDDNAKGVKSIWFMVGE